MKNSGALLVAAVAALAPLTGSAQTRRVPPPPPPMADPYAPCESGDTVPARTHAKYDCSGTIGRIGLGASPFHPEGPGNTTFTR